MSRHERAYFRAFPQGLHIRRGLLLSAVALGGIAAPIVATSADNDASYTTYGTPGLIEMPSGQMAPADELAVTMTGTDTFTRTTLTFQILPRLSGSFRYSYIKDFDDTLSRYDRSFDLSYQIAKEGEYTPSVVIGLRDFGGTGVFGSEFVAASKQVTPKFAVTGGLGWGRLGSYNGFDNPLGYLFDRFKTRQSSDTATGDFSVKSLFSGDVAPFAGIEWRPTERLTFKAEYSSDDYAEEQVRRTNFEKNSPFNFGATYETKSGVGLSAYYLYGSTFALSATVALNPGKMPYPSGIEGAPPPVMPAPLGQASLSWLGAERPNLNSAAEAALSSQGLVLENLAIDGDTATIRFVNPRYPSMAEAIGRGARALSGVLPASVSQLRFVPVKSGVPTTAVTIARADLSELEFAPDASWQSFARADLADAADVGRDPAGNVGYYPNLSWRLRPYTRQSFFDPDSPLRINLGAEFSADYTVLPGVTFSGALRQKVTGNLDQSTRTSDSILPHVRSDSAIYDKNNGIELTYLTAEYLFRPLDDVYGRATVGMLEREYGGASGEVLWRPYDSRLALGVEVNYARQRGYDSDLSFLDYDIWTGHASAYYDFGSGFMGEIDAGRYLAGDWGSTFTLARTFDNGFTLGGFFTLTDVSFDDFGEGSFDKGIFLSIPVTWLAGEPSQRSFGTTIRTIQRDGGARLNVRDRLYGLTSDTSGNGLEERWGRFWR